MTTPIFLFSTPRSGSTLLQRILGSHSKISTSPEPYLLLPFIYAMKKQGVFSHYIQSYQHKGLTEFFDFLPDQEKSYYSAVRECVESLYEKSSKKNQYFLDKTPSYDLIVEDIFKMFHSARFIVLVRNPVAAIASAIELWGFGHWRLFPVFDPMVKGLKNILEFAQTHRDQICLTRYEDLLASPESEVKRLAEYLNLDFEDKMISDFTKVSFNGKMGDPTAERYKKISNAPMAKWKQTMNTPFRKRWIRNYMKFIGFENLRKTGYDPDELINGIDKVSNDFAKSIDDLYEMPRDTVKVWFKHLVLERTSKYLM